MIPELAKWLGKALDAPRKPVLGKKEEPPMPDVPVTPTPPSEPTPVVVVDPQTQAKAVMAAIAGVLQALNLLGLSVGAASSWLDAKSATIMGVISAVLGVVQIVLPALKRKAK